MEPHRNGSCSPLLGQDQWFIGPINMHPVIGAEAPGRPGCLPFKVTPTADPPVWVLGEAFADQAAFEAHQSRTRASDWYRATAHLSRDFRFPAES